MGICNSHYLQTQAFGANVVLSVFEGCIDGGIASTAGAQEGG